MAIESIQGGLGGAGQALARPIGERAIEGGQRPGASGGASFAAALESALDELGETQAVADGKAMALVTGQDVAVHEVMAAVTEAEIATQLTTAVAVKAIQAYQEIWRMEI